MRNRMNYSKLCYESQMLFLNHIDYELMEKVSDCFCLLESKKGFGKSTLGIILAKRWIDLMKLKRGYTMNFSLKKHIIYDDDVQEILKRINELPMFSPLLFDEGGRIILAEDWNRKENKRIKKLFAEIRTKQLFVIINSPFMIQNIDKKQLQNFIDFWVHLWGQGYSTIFAKNLHPLKPGYDLQQLDRLLPTRVNAVENFREFNTYNNNLRKHPSHMGGLFWKDLGKKEYAEYQEMRDHAVFKNDEEKEETITRVQKKSIIKEMKLLKCMRDEGKSWKEISGIIDLKETTTRQRFSKYLHLIQES